MFQVDESQQVIFNTAAKNESLKRMRVSVTSVFTRGSVACSKCFCVTRE